jgi:FMN phosphatase YigB (HAD superfamily)
MIQLLQRFLIKYIVWDFDGTLYQNPKLGNKLKQFFFNKAKQNQEGLSIDKFDQLSTQFGSWSAAASYISKIDEPKLLSLSGQAVDKTRYLLPDPKIVSLIEKKLSRYLHLILTNSTFGEVESCLKVIGFGKTTFEKIFTRDNTGLIKPNPLLFTKITQYTKSPKCRHLFIGDSISQDILPAQKQRFPAIPIWDLSKLSPQLLSA